VVLCEVRWTQANDKARAEYEAAHLPGAIFVDLDVDLSDPPAPERGRHPLPSPERFAERLGALGIGDDDVLIAYDDKRGGVAARLVWMWRVTGRRAALLDGLPDEREAGAVTRAPRALTAVPWPADALCGLAELPDASVLVDARAPERYRGETEPLDPRAGHIPGAVNVPWMGNVDDAGRVRPRAELRARFEAAGAGAPGAVVYCGSGVTACHDALVCEHAGLPRPRLYVGSWSQWCGDEARPAALGDEP
jgi:thiosulfate/3-mercaptopyruvate sulfurtransferase